MTNFRKLTTAAAALTVGTLMSTGAMAMTCGEYNAMAAEDQLSARAEMGREGARDMATGEDSTEAGVATEQANDDGTKNDDAGKEGRDDMARGDDEAYAASIVEHCKGGDDLMVKDAMHPTAG
ncbi:hypothetical protein SAMN05421666_0988 [Roseovarius nanhaiticus]|uniref:HdeA/HdeB family protein n=1 Tax=Roseovarius nanhaiticus TaxID=573024 RepID=A0A1N7FF57_9RHOB|nr:hypothetical protein [Roseovarius nanhaiticus]SEK55842.1 hypothetical protein SAMN05216208_1148 [Roseovarius nanhaiticus]SIR98999.1 hypothetical protein SAMN05421666_0988 [Roseovarius nanhaiticus]